MIIRRSPLLILVLLAFALPAHAARVLNRYDIDSLSAMSRLIVKVEVGEATDVQTRDGKCAVWEAKVLSTLHGDVPPQTVIRIAGIEEYQKGPGVEGVEKGFPLLSRGDVVYLFLVPKGTPIGYSKYDLTNADWKVIESGARLLLKDHVHSFGQYYQPGPSIGPVPGFVAMTEKTFPKSKSLPVEEFEKQVKASLAYVDELRRKLAANTLTDEEKRAVLAGRADARKRDGPHTDYIPHLFDGDRYGPTTRPAKKD